MGGCLSCFEIAPDQHQIFAAWWWWPVAPLVSWWKRYGWGIWSGPNNIDVGVAGQLEYAMNVYEHNGG